MARGPRSCSRPAPNIRTGLPRGMCWPLCTQRAQQSHRSRPSTEALEPRDAWECQEGAAVSSRTITGPPEAQSLGGHLQENGPQHLPSDPATTGVG